MDDNLVICPECRNYVTYTVVEQVTNSILEGENYEHVEQIAYCAKCGSEIYVGEILDSNLKALYDAYRVKNDLIALEKILEIPQKYSIDLKSLSEVLGWEDKLLTRYCEGYLPKKQNSDLLLRIYNDPEYFAELIKNRIPYNEN